MLERISAWIYTRAAVIALARYRTRFQKQFNKPLPIILVAGNVGKSTVTLLLNQVFTAAGYSVLSGTTQFKNFNTPMGFLSQLLGLPEAQDLLGHVKLLMTGFFLRSNVNPKKSTIIIQEIGVDEQGGALRYNKIFKHVDMVVMAGLTVEHSLGFSEILNAKALQLTSPLIPKSILNQLSQCDTRLKNSILEQLQLLNISDTAIIPSELGVMNNSYYIITPETAKSAPIQHIDTHYTKTQLVVGGNKLNPQYLLPDTFGITVGIIQETAKHFSINKKTVATALESAILPVSRYSIFHAKKPFSNVVDSTYNSDPASLEGLLHLLKIFSNQAPYHVVVLGEMRELGTLSQAEHTRALLHIQKLSKTIPMKIILLGQEWLKNEQVWNKDKNIAHFLNVGEIVNYVETALWKDKSWLWCKGSQNTIFLEELVKSQLKNPTDAELLCRQSKQWINKKTAYIQV